MTTQVPEITTPPPVRIAKELLKNSAFLLARLGFTFKAKAIEEVEQAGFSLYDYSVLEILGEQARETQATIADTLGLALDAESREALHTLLLRLACYHDPRCGPA